MVERIQDLNLPNSNITKIIRDSLPGDVNMDKEARIAIARATSVFIMYLSSNAAAMAHKHNHKTFSAQDVMDSINDMDFKSFAAPMKQALIAYQKTMKDKKDNKKNSLEARKSVGTPNQLTPAATAAVTAAAAVATAAAAAAAASKVLITPTLSTSISPNKTANHKMPTQKTPQKSPQKPVTISADIIEIDDSD